MRANPCIGGKCQNGCATINEDDRKKIFDNYYRMNNSQRQKDWLLSCTQQIPVKRKRTKNAISRRLYTIEYSVTVEGVRRKVCLQFLLKTLDISQMSVRYTLKNCSSTGTVKKDMRGHHRPHNKTEEDKEEEVKGFIKTFPAVPSHYCRQKTKKLYLPAEVRNATNFYRMYKSDCKSKSREPVSYKVFHRIFKLFNLGFHVPKKDKCVRCEKVKHIGEDKLTPQEKLEYEEHLQQKEECKLCFSKDQQCKEQGFLCASFDMQKVLNTPCGESMLLYYSRKIAVYNFTVYESSTKHGYCFLWDETQGKRGANEICTALFKYLLITDNRLPSTSNISLFCDSCPGQNRNKQMLAMLYTFLQESKNIQHIKVTFLLPGHTYMPADSIHSTIDTFIKKRIIWAPSQWSTVVSLSRTNPYPYNVTELQYTDFEDWKTISAIIPSTTVNNKPFRISDIKSAILQKNTHIIELLFDYVGNNATSINLSQHSHRRGRSMSTGAPVMLQRSKIYKDRLPISLQKYRDLERLCSKNIIPDLHHEEYNRLPTASNVEDVLAETDEEDK